MSNKSKRASKINPSIKSLIISIRKQYKATSCRAIASYLQKHYKMKISKSSIGFILKESSLSGSVGRPATKSFRTSATTKGAGYTFLFGADRLLRFSQHIAELTIRLDSSLHIKQEALEAAYQAFILAKAFYNIPLSKLIEYRKEEVWLIMGKKVNKSLLMKLNTLPYSSQLFKEQLVTNFSKYFRDIHCIKVILANEKFYYFDGKLKTMHAGAGIPIDFCVTYDMANNYVIHNISGEAPWVIFDVQLSAKEDVFSSLFLPSFLHSDAEYAVKSFQFIDIKGDVIFSEEISQWHGQKFIIGFNPSQASFVSGFVQDAEWQKCDFSEPGVTVYYAERNIIFTQHVLNKEVTLRTVLLKTEREGAVERGLLTNLDALEKGAFEVIKLYLDQCADFKKSPLFYYEAMNNPVYLDRFLAMEKIFSHLRRIQNLSNFDDFLLNFVEVLDLFAKRSFFGFGCQEWSFLKTKELFYKQEGCLYRDTSEYIICKLFGNSMLQDFTYQKEAILRFNECPVFDASDRKVWLEFAPNKQG